MDYDIEVVELPSRPAAVVRRAEIRPEDVGGFVAVALGEVMEVVRRQGVLPAGPPFTRYGPGTGGHFCVEVGLPTRAPVRDVGRVAAAELPGGRAVRTRHVGSYDGVGAAHDALKQWMAEHGLAARDLAWESYLDGPEVSHPRTDVVVPCRHAA